MVWFRFWRSLSQYQSEKGPEKRLQGVESRFLNPPDKQFSLRTIGYKHCKLRYFSGFNNRKSRCRKLTISMDEINIPDFIGKGLYRA